jgi:hypothetical protein
MRRFAERAGKGDPLANMTLVQQSINKWFPRGLEMFGDERGGQKNLQFGFKDMSNREAVNLYIEEVRKMLHDINTRFVRARFPEYTPDKVEAVIDELERERGVHRGLASEDLLHLPDPRFFRRKGEPAFQMVGLDGEAFTDVETYLRYLARHLNDGYVASRDMRLYAETLRQVVAGTLTAEQGVKAMPKLKRLGGSCPCSRSVRWVMEENDGTATTVMTRPA